MVEELYREVSAQTIRNLPAPPTDNSQDGVRFVRACMKLIKIHTTSCVFYVIVTCIETFCVVGIVYWVTSVISVMCSAITSGHALNRSALSLILSTLNGIASAIQDGEYDSNSPKEALVCVCMCVRACVCDVCMCVRA